MTLIVFGLLIGTVAGWLFAKYRQTFIKVVPQQDYDNLDDQVRALITEKCRAEERAQGLESQLREVKGELETERGKLFTLSSDLAGIAAERANLLERLENQKSELNEIQQKFTTEFQNLANRLLEETGRKFTEQNSTNIGGLLGPLQERLKDFQKKVEDTYDKESKQRFSLEKEIQRLAQLNQQMSKDATNLTNALKGESKTQGNWGEMILESILEKSGLAKDREFRVQETKNNEEGSRLRPDVVVNLPEGKNVVIDSKVSLKAYEEYCSMEDENQRSKCLAAHVASIRNHIKILKEKNYQGLYGISSPDFVLLFMPIEPAFGLAVNSDQSLFAEAFEKNIIIVSPTTLLATLRTVANIWRQEYQSRNVQEIAKQAGDLYDKFVGFVMDLQTIGKRLDDAQDAHKEAMKKLNTGKGNLVRRAEGIRQLGVKTTKTLPAPLVDAAESEEDAAPPQLQA